MKGKVNVNIEHDVRFSYEINDRFTIEAAIRNSGVPSIHIKGNESHTVPSYGKRISPKERDISELIFGLQELLIFLDMNTHKE